MIMKMSMSTTRNPNEGVAGPMSLGERFRIGASLIPPFAIVWMMSRADWVPVRPFICFFGMPLALGIGMAFPKWFAAWHRGFSAVQSWIGRRLVAGLLGLVFVLVVVPVAFVLRLAGRDFLDRGKSDSYWAPSRPPGSLKNQF